jgi:hypothetical protein
MKRTRARNVESVSAAAPGTMTTTANARTLICDGCLMDVGVGGIDAFMRTEPVVRERANTRPKQSAQAGRYDVIDVCVRD